MKTHFLVLWIVGILFCQHLHAAVPEGTPIPASIMVPLARWVEQASNMKIHALPMVVASGFKLKTSLGLQGVQQARSVAAYLPGQIIINNIIWDPDSVRAHSYLVHEMVHHAQTLNAKRYACNDAKERDAYMLQNRWLVERGEDPIYDQDWIDEVSVCH